MKGIQLVKTGDANKAFEVRELNRPEPKIGEVLIKVNSFGLNYADVMARNGLYKDAPPIPCTLGYEAVGIVEQIGQKVESFREGDRVLAFTRFGAYAEYCIADQRAIVKIGNKLTDAEATAVATQFCTAYFASYYMANIQGGEKILVHAAAGGVGLAVVQLAKLRGCKIYATAGSDDKIKFLEELGVDKAINYRKFDFQHQIQEKVDVIFDPIGGSSFKKGKKLLSHGGRIICYGGAERSGGGLLSTLKFVWNFGFFTPIALLMKSQGIIGVNMLRIADNKPELLQQLMREVIDLVNAGEIKPYIGNVYKHNDIAKAHQYLESRESIGKIVVEW